MILIDFVRYDAPRCFLKTSCLYECQGVVVSQNVQSVVMKAIDVGNDFKNKQEFESYDQILQ